MTAFLFIFVLVLFYLWRRWQTYNSNMPPGPVNIPLLGCWEMAQLWLKDDNLMEMLQKMGDRYGPVFMFRIAMDTPVVVIRKLDALKEASRDMTLQSSNMQYFYQMMGGWHDYGVSFSDGKAQMEHRRFIMRLLGQFGYRNDTWLDTVRYECAKAVEHLLSGKGRPVNIKDCMGLSSNSTLQITMGQRLDVDEKRFRTLHRNITHVLMGAAKIQSWLDVFPWLAHIAPESTFYSKMKGGLEGLYDEVDAAIETHRAEFKPEEEPRDAIDAYLASVPESQRSWADLRVLIKDMIIGGYESTGVLLGWIMLLLAKHTDVQEKVQVEIDSTIGPDRAPNPADDKDCPLTCAVIDEVLRFVTLVPVTRHFTTHGSTTLRGYHIPRGAVVLTDNLSVHYDAAVWGDPDVFRPERFLGTAGARLRDHVRGFGTTQRVCPAEKYARKLAFLFMTGVLQKVRIRLPEGVQVGAENIYSLGVFPENPLVIAEQRN